MAATHRAKPQVAWAGDVVPEVDLTAAGASHRDVPSPAMLLQSRVGAAFATADNAYGLEPAVGQMAGRDSNRDPFRRGVGELADPVGSGEVLDLNRDENPPASVICPVIARRFWICCTAIAMTANRNRTGDGSCHRC